MRLSDGVDSMLEGEKICSYSRRRLCQHPTGTYALDILMCTPSCFFIGLLGILLEMQRKMYICYPYYPQMWLSALLLQLEDQYMFDGG